ncbi:MAG: AbrB/MazE/SpoVT family DNA-binding domain-containing protein [Firmicutes bacterium]|nr:AbrB/MazE/SpoVT family DNA-binding domain-containing protein [Bacillota bacterium]
METAKVFANGGSQAVRLPKDCRFDAEEVLVNRIGNVVLLMPKDDPWSSMMTGLALFTDDFLREPPDDPVPEERPGL